MILQIVREHAREHVRAHPLLQTMMDRANLQIQALERAESALDLREALVRANHLRCIHRLGRQTRAQDIQAVQSGLLRDLLLLAPESKLIVLDVELEVLANLMVVVHFANAKADLGLATQGPASDALADRLQFLRRGSQQALALACALCGQQRIPTDDQAFCRIDLGMLDLSEIALVE